MERKINCIYNDDFAWCNCKKVKKSLFGIGDRLCIERHDGEKCDYKKGIPKPTPPPPTPPPPKRIITDGVRIGIKGEVNPSRQKYYCKYCGKEN